ncbi:hypothetical protein B1759_05005 [Rubrivirga sp. SAORIC476]|uniref:right-handed parallel beta-helix repeat-containing protein n=1 Tax=Rubrivirga sp. SAORIC476 TaxID=1961794 RepID=UPI000BA8E089|nr:right-handed parallel beta-helix repeat-containing protein [Rubrivirga sp. SAORIC476]PAP80735.1 hypothetical protein B1759_05005 [Rubrivirga sp. SAORIC476]
MLRSLLLAALAVVLALPASAQLSGTYTVGGALPNYSTISAAVADLNALGTSGPVTFQIRPGTYDEQVTISSFPRLGAADDMVTFTRSAPLAASPVWRASGVGSSTNWVVRLNGADYVSFAGITFEAVGATYGRLVTFENEATHNTLSNCTFTGITGASADTGSLLWADNTANDDNTVTGSTFTHGYVGLDFNDSLTPFNARTTVSGSTFASQTERGIEITGSGAIVDGNQVSSWAASNASYRGIYVWSSASAPQPVEITGNEVDLSIGDVGIWLGSTSGTQRLMANNTVALRSDGTAAIYLQYGDVDVVHNTAIIAQGATSASALFVEDGAPVNDVVLANNLLIDDAGGFALRAPGGQIEASDTNNLYSSVGGTYIGFGGSGYSTLSAYQSATGLDANSIAVAVTFADPPPGTPDLHLGGSSLDDLSLIGVPFAAVTTDIDGDARDGYNPKMGADEGTPLPPLDNADAPSGFYAVAGSSPSFLDPAEAFDALKARGMKGPVTFRIRPGTFTFRESLPPTIRVGPAASDPASALLAIRGANPSNKPVLVSGAASGTNWTLRLRGLDHVELNNLIFDASAAGVDGRILELDLGVDGLGADDVSILNSTFIGSTFVGGTDERALVWSDGDGHDRLTVSGSTFTGGWAGIHALDGPFNATVNEDWAISDNTFENQTRYGFYVSQPDGVVIDGNTFSGSDDDLQAIYIGYNKGFAITGNQIALTGIRSFGVHMDGSDADASGVALLANNFVRADRPVLLGTGVTGIRIIHNSLYASGTNATPLWVVGSSDEVVELTNNVLKSATSGPALELFEVGNLLAADGNVYHTVTGPALVTVDGTDYADLAAWQAASGLDARSRSFNVAFQNAGQGDLHLGATSDGDPRLAGVPGTGILADFDGELRSVFNPTIGADEATELAPLAGTYDVGTPPPGFPAEDFATLQEGLDAVHYLGVSDNVTLRFHDDFGGFPVTVRPFDGAAEDQRLVVLPYVPANQYAYSPTDAASNGAIRVEGADHVTIGYMFIDLTGGTGGHGQALRLEGEVDDLRLPFFGGFGVSGSASSEAALIGGATATTTNLWVDQGFFDGGAYGVYLNGGPSSGTTVTNSTFVDLRAAGIRLIEHDDVTISDVEITSAQANADGIVLEDGQGAAIDRARIQLSGTSGLASYAINLNAQSGTFADPVSVTNSFLTGGDQGVVILDVDHARFAHNTIRALDAAAPGVFRSAGANGTNIQLVNNILVHEGGGRVLSVDDGGEFTALGPNDLVTSGPVLASWNGTDYADLAAYQAGTGFGSNSVSVPVTFADAAAGDLHLDGASDGDQALGALPLADVTDDIDGDTRSTSYVYLGADEAGTPLTPPTPDSYAVMGPAALGAFAHGDAVNVAWTTLDPTLEAGNVRVSVLCPGQAPFVRYASTANDGQAGFAVPVSLGTHGGVDDQAAGCTVEVASVADPSRAAVSAPFVVTDDGVGGVTTRKLDLATGFSPARYGLQDVIKWFWDETTVPTGNVRLALVCDGRDRWIRYANTANDGQASATLPATFGAYDVCRTEVTSLADPTFFGRSAPFQVLDTPLPSVDVLAPADEDVIAMGADVDITWETVGVAAGNAIRILLVDLTNGPPNRLVAQTTNTGTYTWSVPTDLDPSAEYRLSVKATADDGTFPTALIDPLTFVSAGSLTASASASAEALPTELAVLSARPNPTRSRATVRVGLPEAGPVDVAVYDAVGRRVAVLASGERGAGWHDLGVEAGDLAPGVYVVRAMAGDTVATRTLTVVR